MISNYCKSYNFGHRHLENFFSEPVTVEEKYDGSQFSFGVFDGKLVFRSRNRVFDIHDADDLFRATCDHLETQIHNIKPGGVYRGEAFKGPKHNILKYDRCPEGHLVLFEVPRGLDLAEEAANLGVHPVKTLARDVTIGSLQEAESYLDNKSSLGDTLVEGVVFKRRHSPLYNPHDQLIMAKLVSPAFREKQSKGFINEARTTKTLLERLTEEYHCEMRFHKAFQHLQEQGRLEYEPRDIRLLVEQVKVELWEDEKEEILDSILRSISKRLERGIVRGLPEWYKALLAEKQFDR